MSMAPPPLRQYNLHWVTKKEDKKWFKEHKESKYSHDMFIDRNCLSLVFPHMVDSILTLGLGFMFNALGDCNLNMVREFLANWMSKERVGPGYEEPLDDDVATEDEMARVDSDIESSDEEEEDSEMGGKVGVNDARIEASSGALAHYATSRVRSHQHGHTTRREAPSSWHVAMHGAEERLAQGQALQQVQCGLDHAQWHG
ncbi:hypothetical protein HAX54_010863 [Datura stramonium]|uniref:Uncharacterized protein n=1 Tax=Datura stramonium TaxID=4076 RepID=A0ABS8TGY3_DATST|nr:hypothetical protein [Datura stramonium]